MSGLCDAEDCCPYPTKCTNICAPKVGPIEKPEFDIVAAMSKVRDVILTYGQACVKAGKEMADSLNGIDEGATESEKLALEHFTASMFKQVMDDVEKGMNS